MNSKTKKALIFSGLGVDVAITIFLFVLSIILLAKMPDSKRDIDPATFTGWFLDDPIRILLICVIPLVALLILNVTVLFVYMKKTAPKKEVKLSDLSEEEKDALRKKIAEELMAEKKEEK